MKGVWSNLSQVWVARCVQARQTEERGGVSFYYKDRQCGFAMHLRVCSPQFQPILTIKDEQKMRGNNVPWFVYFSLILHIFFASLWLRKQRLKMKFPIENPSKQVNWDPEQGQCILLTQWTITLKLLRDLFRFYSYSHLRIICDAVMPRRTRICLHYPFGRVLHNFSLVILFSTFQFHSNFF